MLKTGSFGKLRTSQIAVRRSRWHWLESITVYGPNLTAKKCFRFFGSLMNTISSLNQNYQQPDRKAEVKQKKLIDYLHATESIDSQSK